MKKAVIYGGGNIGRGFIGQLFFLSGYETKFIDIDERVINEFNDRHSYDICLASIEAVETITVRNVSAVDGKDTASAVGAIADAEIMAVSVGVHVLPYIIDTLVAGFRRRWEQNVTTSLNVLVCENLMNASDYLGQLLEKKLTDTELELFRSTIGFVDTTIGRMVPAKVLGEEEHNILDITVEPFCELPVDKEAFIGDVPNIYGMKATAPFEVQTLKKLFIHNMGHAVCAYLGQIYGETMICEAIQNEVIQQKVREAMMASAKAIAKAYDVPMDYLADHVEDLIKRFHNPHTKDTVARVGKDPIRKLKKADRLTGAALLCEKMGIDSSPIVQGIASALFFEDKMDTNWLEKRASFETGQKIKAISELLEMPESSRLVNVVADTYDLMTKNHNSNIVINFWQ